MESYPNPTSKHNFVYFWMPLQKNCFLMGDFNLDAKMELRNDYLYKVPHSLLTDFLTLKNLVQLVNIPTWTRTINGVKKSPLWTMFIQIMAHLLMT